jgi:hypothetical protein
VDDSRINNLSIGICKVDKDCGQTLKPERCQIIEGDRLF